ncbi:hypothetical protein GALMADRAFT_74425 [Galerina marginata CBS 339.88]|uniref:C2 domain-containing protein n=1 Tax=Galerina marginata (strain CBS 339.88) TaxID=685588 RepID=A0A067SWD0_GALM3|nr:hypothetical protein GALMADRAFT_74425 [Galerina marginata CBS 339.88]
MSAPTLAPTTTTVQKRTKFERVFKAAGRLPRFPAINFKPGFRSGIGIGRNGNLSPSHGEAPVAVLKLQVLGCSNLPAKGSINPFVVVSLLNKKSTTPVAKRTANPVYPVQDTTSDFPLYLSLVDRLGVVKFVV